jgi:uncharacterized membrane protein required for colicin V production
MIILDVIILAFIALLFYRGFKRGYLVSVVGIVGLFCSYAGAYFLFEPVGLLLSESYEIPNFISYSISGIAVFITIYLLFSVLSMILSRTRKKRINEGSLISAVDQWLGGFLGATVGVVIVCVFIWMYNLSQLSPAGDVVPDVSGSIAGKVSKAAIEYGTYAMASALIEDEQTAKMVARTISDPASTADDIKKIMDNPKIDELKKDTDFLEAVKNGDTKRLVSNKKLTALINDPETLATAKDLGIIPRNADSAFLQQEASEKLAKIGHGINEIQNDPQLLKILEDPEIQQKLQNMDIQGLMMDPEFNEIVQKIMDLSDL